MPPAPQPVVSPLIVGPYYPSYPAPLWHPPHQTPFLPPAMPPPHVSEPPFPINGVRSPQSYFDEMRGRR